MKINEATKSLQKQRKIVLINLLIDVITVLPVISIALLSNSLILISDIFDYLFSISSGIMSINVLNRCVKNERGKYDYGFGKLESVAAIISSFFMLLMMSLVAFRAVTRIMDTEELEPDYIIIAIAMQIIGAVINIFLYLNAKKLSDKGGSPIIDAQWRVNKANALGNIFIIVSLLLGLWLNEYKWANYIDPISAILLIIITAKSFIVLIKKSFGDLLDHSLEEPIQLNILKRLAEYEDGYERFYEIKSRKSGSKMFIDIYLGFDPMRSVGEVFYIGRRVKEILELDIPNSEVNIINKSLEDFEETIYGINLSGVIIPLTEKHLDECMEIAKRSFPEDDPNEFKTEFLMSIYPNKYKHEMEKLNYERMNYWVIIEDDVVKGFCGFGFLKDEPDVVWGGWAATLAGDQKTDLRIKMHLSWRMAYEARQSGKKIFKILTSTFPLEIGANKMWDNLGFKIYKTEKLGDHFINYKQLETAKLYERLKPGKKRHYRTIT